MNMVLEMENHVFELFAVLVLAVKGMSNNNTRSQWNDVDCLDGKIKFWKDF